MKISKCESCNKVWHYQLDRCIFCLSELKQTIDSDLQVIGKTQIHVPSLSHTEIPYSSLLLKGKETYHFIKSINDLELNSPFFYNSKNTKKIKLGLVGSGIMSVGLAIISLNSGHSVVLKSRSTGQQEETLKKIRKGLEKLGHNQESLSKYLEKLKLSTNYSDLFGSDLIIENVKEDLSIKQEVFEHLDQNCPNSTLASNTSSLSIQKIAEKVSNKERVLGLHFFNPVQKMHLVELAPVEQTNEKSIEKALKFSKSIGKSPLIVKDSSCFIVNRALAPLINEAARMVELKLGKPKEIDKAIVLGLNHPIGPLKLADLSGLDVVKSVMDNLYRETGEEIYKPTNIIKKLVQSGKLGKKSGEGFFSYK